MKNFFQGFNLARGIILASVVGCLVLGFLCWKRSQQVADLRDAYQNRTPSAVKDLVQVAQRHTQLSQSLKGEGLKGQEDLVSYIRRVGAKDRVEIGELNMTLQETPLTNGIIDKKYTIKPDSPTATFKRMMIVNFLYTLEDDSRRVKLTRVKMEVADQKGLKTHEVPKDDWKFDCELTSRQRKAAN
ncbi:MAG: hypothetical protein SGI72_10975 [Planctomycetota bacterium]|nr:hypothetical protein [Planctomycetota bacterium]